MLSKMPPELISLPGGPAGGTSWAPQVRGAHPAPRAAPGPAPAPSRSPAQCSAWVIGGRNCCLFVPVSYSEDGAGGEGVLDSALYGVVSLHIHRRRRLVQKENLVPEWELQ